MCDIYEKENDKANERGERARRTTERGSEKSAKIQNFNTTFCGLWRFVFKVVLAGLSEHRRISIVIARTSEKETTNSDASRLPNNLQYRQQSPVSSLHMLMYFGYMNHLNTNNSNTSTNSIQS
jgi:hypothetical protein